MKNPIKMMMRGFGAALGMLSEMRETTNYNIKPGSHDPFAPSGIRMSGNKSAGSYNYRGPRGGRPRNRKFAGKSLRYA